MSTRVASLIACAVSFAAPAVLTAADNFHTGQFTRANGYTPNLTLLTGPYFLSPAPAVPTFRYVAPKEHNTARPPTAVKGTISTADSPAPTPAASSPATLRFDAQLPTVPTSLIRPPSPTSGAWQLKPAVVAPSRL